MANEILLCDKVVTANEALKYGFANGIIDTFDKSNDWPDPSMIPVIPKLLATDYRTLINGMEQNNLSKDLKRIEEVTYREAKALVAIW